MRVNKRILQGLLGAVLGTMLLWNGTADAGLITGKIPMLTYADTTVPTFDKPNGKRMGFISPNVSLVYIKEIRGDGWAYGSYPIISASGKQKRVYRWFQMQELQGFWNFANYALKIDGERTVYRTTEQAGKTGKVLDKQDVMVVGEKSDQLKIVYRVSGSGEFKMGWVNTVSDKRKEEEERKKNEPDLPVNININIENNPTIQNDVNVVSTNTNTNTSTNTNTNENNNTNENENTNTNTNENENTNLNQNENQNQNQNQNQNSNQNQNNVK